MSAVVAGVCAGTLGAVAFGISAWVTHRSRSPKADFKRADRFAKEVDLYLPEELVAQVASRLRRRMVLGLVLSALIAGPWLGYLVVLFAAGMDDPAVGRVDFQAVPFPGASGMVLIAAPGMVITLLEGVWEVARARGEASTLAGLLAQPAVAVRLRHAVPVWLIWAARVLAVLPALVAAGACATQGRAGLALGFAALAPLGWLVAWSVERLQLWMLNSGRLAGRADLLPQQAAFDDAFRVTMALPLLPLAPCLGVLAGGFYIHLVGHGFWYQGLMLTWGPSVVPIIVLNGLLNTNWAKRYHRRDARNPAPAAS